MSLSQEPTFSTLRNHFVCGYKNIMQENYAGESGVHPIDGTAVSTTNGAGPHNLQTFVMTADGTILHCLPGYWNSADLASELALAEKLNYIWEDKAITAVDKAELFKRLHLEHLADHSPELIARSHLQGFDAQHIYKNSRELADCVSDLEAIKNVDAHNNFPYSAFKSTDKIMHERLAKRPFASYRSFDIAAYTNYGCNHYDKGENEIETEGEGRKSTSLALKGKSLRNISKPTTITSPIATASCRPENAKKATVPEIFAQLGKQQRWQEAFSCADKYIRSQFSKPGGYEMRSLAALKLGLYQQSYDDASRALWLGSRHKTAYILRDAAASFLENRLVKKLADKKLADKKLVYKNRMQS